MASGKPTRQKANRKSYLQNGITNKIKKAIKEHKDKKYNIGKRTFVTLKQGDIIPTKPKRHISEKKSYKTLFAIN